MNLKLIALSVACFLLSACDKGREINEQQSYEWAINFCGSKDKMDSFLLSQGYLPDRVWCADGRRSDIPGTVK